MKTFLYELFPALRATGVLCLVTCGAYPLLVTGVAETFFKSQAHGSLITDGSGTIRGSYWIGQSFTSETYFHSRPSTAGEGYDAAASGGSNLGPTSQKLHDLIEQRITAYRSINGLSKDTAVPADAVTTSASGLDPHISVGNAQLQAPRVAQARGLSLDDVQRCITDCTEKRDLGFLGDARVHVLKLNLALDDLKPVLRHE